MTPETLTAIMHRGVPLAASWGVTVLDAADGVARLRLPADPLLLRPGNTVSGPAIMGLADVAMWMALLTTTQGRDNSVTSTMNVNFLRPAGPGPLVATARVVKAGKRMVYGEVLIGAEEAEEPAVHVTTHWVVIAKG
ncbi:MAG: PaaI family thioesterase [Alphaproteobacteria bacterium]|nr:PaaI family thioesterase [Alphaproteobacteria bacterium]